MAKIPVNKRKSMRTEKARRNAELDSAVERILHRLEKTVKTILV